MWERASHSGAALVIIDLAALLVVVIAFPDVGSMIRSVFDKRTWKILGIVSIIISILGFFGISVPWVWGKLWGQPGGRVTEAPVQPDAHRKQAARNIQDDVRTVARQISDLAYDYRQRSPFRVEDVPSDAESPEYREVSQRYDAHKDEMRRHYRSNLLPEVVRLRGALAEYGITDAQLDALYQRPRTFEETEVVALRLFDMAGRLERSL
jgi:hypothetical protein